MITNHTIYEGKPFLTLERHPYYLGGNPRTKLNKIHLDLGFVKLVSRVVVGRLDKTKVDRITSHPGVVCKAIKYSDDLQKVIYEQEHAELNHLPGVLNCLFNKKGNYIGDMEVGLWMVTHNIIPDEEVPHIGTKGEDWIGWSHRASHSFKIGDQLFDPSWRPRRVLDYVEDFQEAFMKLPEREQIGLLEDHDKFKEWAIEYIPFFKRGDTTIISHSQARQAAINFADYVG